MRNTVIHLADCRPKRALEALNRITRLEWDRMPVSLVGNPIEFAGTQSDPAARKIPKRQRSG